MMIIDLGIIASNWKRLTQLVKRGCQPSAVLKCDAYGVGLAPVAKVLHSNGCKHAFVGTLEEGIEAKRYLREAKITVLYPVIPDELAALNRFELGFVVNSECDLEMWVARSPELPATIRVDTGMSSLGIDWRRMCEITASGRLSRANVAVLMTQLAAQTAYNLNTSREQVQRFERIANAINPPQRSVSSSVGLVLGPEFHYDLLRSGSFVLGFDMAPDETCRLENPIKAENDCPV